MLALVHKGSPYEGPLAKSASGQLLCPSRLDVKMVDQYRITLDNS